MQMLGTHEHIVHYYGRRRFVRRGCGHANARSRGEDAVTHHEHIIPSRNRLSEVGL